MLNAQKQQDDLPIVEQMRPLPFHRQDTMLGRFLFSLRIILDLRLNAIYGSVRGTFPDFRGNVLDIGCGGQPWRWLLEHCDYLGIDIYNCNQEYGYSHDDKVVYYDGKNFPFDDHSFDHILCTEVLEHVKEPVEFLHECNRCLKLGGSMYFTIPFSARFHYIPNDYWRFTPSGLSIIFGQAGFEKIKISPVGNEVSVIVNKVNLLILKRILNKKSNFFFLWMERLLGVLLLPVFSFLTIAGLIAIKFDIGSSDDPLGYELIIQK